MAQVACANGMRWKSVNLLISAANDGDKTQIKLNKHEVEKKKRYIYAAT